MARPSGRALIDFLNHNALSRSAKNLRNGLVDGYFRSRHRERGKSFANSLPDAAREALCVTVAFRTPWVVDVLTAAWRRFHPGMTLVVLDNSPGQEDRETIESICRQRDVPYLALPSNPEWSPNRSHGISMNWAYYNLIFHVRPEIFGFIDHDCFPIASASIPARMAGKDVYGVGATPSVKDSPWSPWAGFCFFRFSEFENGKPDFKHRIELGLDTGGGNWNVVYRFLRPEQVLPASRSVMQLSFAGIDARHEVFDGRFLHLGGASYQGSFSRAEYRRLLSDHIWGTFLGGRSGRLVEP